MGIFGTGPRNLVNESALIFGAFNLRLSSKKPIDFMLYQEQPHVDFVLLDMRHDNDMWAPVSDLGV
jgi:hypothetical protein